MRISFSRWFAAALLCAMVSAAVCAQTEQEKDLDARKRLFPEIATGALGVKRGPLGRYYVLISRGVQVFDTGGAKIAEIPSPAAGNKSAPALVYGVAFDVDSDGRVYVADRGGNALRVFSPGGAPLISVPFNSPTGITALPGGEFAASGVGGAHLVSVFNLQGKEVRTFGDPIDAVDDNATFNQFLNIGRVVSDAASNVYFAFNYFPEPTFRKYDRFGYASLNLTLDTVEFAPAAQALRREIKRQMDKHSAPSLKESMSCLGVDPESQEIWMALGDELLLLNHEGLLLFGYRAYTPEGARLAPNSILVEPDRLIFTSDRLGIYEMPRLDREIKPAATAPKQF